MFKKIFSKIFGNNDDKDVLLEPVLSKAILKPVFDKPRHKCPFYGFSHPMMGAMMDSKGNQCALMTDSFSPCLMERNGQTPNWDECQYLNYQGNQEAVQKIIDNFKIYPDEFVPDVKSGWQGIPFKLWMNYVMSDEVERPSAKEEVG